MCWLGSPQIFLNYVRSSQGVFFGFGWRMVDCFFDVASQICNNVDIMNLEFLQYSSKPFLFLDEKQRTITPCSSRIKTQISSKYFKIHSKSMAFSPYSSQQKSKLSASNLGWPGKEHAKHMQKICEQKYLVMALLWPKDSSKATHRAGVIRVYWSNL